MIKAIVTDIEGTITRISFVKDVLFPYAANALPEFVKNNQTLPQVAEQIAATRDILEQPSASIDEVINALLNWIAEDKKITPLKQLQGLIWQTGYEQGDFTGHLYPDAMQFLNTMSERCELYVYSSGSVKAQHLLFQYSDFGDIRPLFKNYFDTKIGGKKDVGSYQNIIDSIGYNADEVLFLSDIVEELDAAKEAGMRTLQLYRDAQPCSEQHLKINNFSEFDLEKFQ